jgi:hypothetical protein
VDSDTDDVSGRDAFRVQLSQGFVNDYRIAKLRRSGGGEDVQPTRRDDRNAKGEVTRIDEVNAHRVSLVVFVV